MNTQRAITLELGIEELRLTTPFHITGRTFERVPVLVVTVRDGVLSGRGEAAGVYYLGDHPLHMLRVLERHREAIEAGITREGLRVLLSPGGARNAVDCALWELESRRAGVPVWELAGLPAPKPLRTTFTVGADEPAIMAGHARAYTHARSLKLKLTGRVDLDIARMRAVRAARPDAWIGVDANQGYVPATLALLLPVLVETGVSLLEQPFARGCEADMGEVDRAIPMAADESVQGIDELESLVGRFDVANIKLDKCGGLTEGLLMARRARELGLGVMVGNMVGTSLAMAPGFVLGQLCDISDLDGALFLAEDRQPSVVYADGHIDCPPVVWGFAGPVR